MNHAPPNGRSRLVHTKMSSATTAADLGHPRLHDSPKPGGRGKAGISLGGKPRMNISTGIGAS